MDGGRRLVEALRGWYPGLCVAVAPIVLRAHFVPGQPVEYQFDSGQGVSLYPRVYGRSETARGGRARKRNDGAAARQTCSRRVQG